MMTELEKLKQFLDFVGGFEGVKEYMIADLKKHVTALEAQDSRAWEPKEGEDCYRINDNGIAFPIEYEKEIHLPLLIRGLIFPTEQDAKDHDRRRIIEAKLRREANFVPNRDELCCYIEFDADGKLSIMVDEKRLFDIPYKSEEDARRIYDKYEDDFKWLMGVA